MMYQLIYIFAEYPSCIELIFTSQSPTVSLSDNMCILNLETHYIPPYERFQDNSCQRKLPLTPTPTQTLTPTRGKGGRVAIFLGGNVLDTLMNMKSYYQAEVYYKTELKFTCSKLTLEKRVFVVNFEHVSHLFLVFP